MNSLNKHFGILLLSCLVFLVSLKSQSAYLDPFQPVYCSGEGDKSSNLKEVPGSKVIIPNMPAIKTQDELGECRAFSLATLVQKYTCDNWKSDVPDCANPPSDLSLSYFGMMIYTHRSLEEEKTFQPAQSKSRSMYDIINEVGRKGKFIVESCKPFHKLVNSFSTSGKAGLEKKDQFFDYLKKMYESKKAKTEAEVADCPECLAEIYKNTGIDPNLIYIKKALSQTSYDKFLYSLFFEGCKLQDFADGFNAKAYPDDSLNVTSVDLKNKIVEGLKKGKPVMASNVCFFTNEKNECKTGHATVISGYRKCCDSKNNCKELFKVHNSWGEDWQKKNNDGWVDADKLTSSNGRGPDMTVKSRIDSASVIWLEP